MSYTFRNVQCYKCKHNFMWQKAGGIEIYEYRHKETKQLLDMAKCPKCGADMLLIPNVLEGISKDSDQVVCQGIRGI